MLLSALLTTLLLAGPALADRDDRRDHRRGWDDRDRREHHDRSRYDNRRYWRDDRWRDGRWGHPGGRHWRRGWQRGWYYAPPPLSDCRW